MNETFLAQLGLLLVSVQITDADAGVIFFSFIPIVISVSALYF